MNTILERWEVTAVATTGDWITLSRAKTTLEFWLVDTNLWDEPIPTLVMFNASGITLRAFSALDANLIVSSLILITYTSPGTLVVVPIPTKDVEAIPIACVAPIPAWMYSTFSPLTKKWFGKVIVLDPTLTTVEALPTKSLLKISSLLWVNGKSLLISLRVPL